MAKYNSLYHRESIDPKIFQNRTEAEIKYLRKSMGALAQSSCGMQFDKDYKEYPEYNHFNFVMMASHVYNKSGTLPFPGSLSEQPAQMMEVLEVLFELDAEREADAQRKAEKEQRHNVRR